MSEPLSKNRSAKAEAIAARGLVKWDEKDENDRFFVLNNGEPGGYDVDVARLTTAAELVNWIYHLREKVWFMC